LAPHWPWQGPKGGETVKFTDKTIEPVTMHEQADLSKKHPEILQRLMTEFDRWNDQMLPRKVAR